MGPRLCALPAAAPADARAPAPCRIVDKAVVFVNAVQGEGSDRTDLKLAHDADALINAVASYCSDTIVVIHSGQTVDMEAWAECAYELLGRLGRSTAR